MDQTRGMSEIPVEASVGDDRVESRQSPRTAARKRRAVRQKGELRRQQIMDAAEEIFSRRGYYGSSLRDVAARSGASLGVITHHFTTKEQLFYDVIDRKLKTLTELVRSSLESSRVETSSPDSTIEAFIKPFLRACVDAQSEIRNYIKLTSLFMSAYEVAEINPALARLRSISDLFCDYLRESVPDMPEKQMRIGVYLIQAALIFMVQDNGFLDRVTNEDFDTSAFNELIGPASAFFAAGLRAIHV